MGVYQLVTLQPGFLHVHLFDRLGVKPEHLLPLEIPCNDAQAIGAGFLKSLQNKGSSVSQPIRLLFTGSIILIKSHLSNLISEKLFYLYFGLIPFFRFRYSNQERYLLPAMLFIFWISNGPTDHCDSAVTWFPVPSDPPLSSHKFKIQGSSHFFPFGFPFFLISFFRKEFLKDGISEFYFSLFSVSGVLMVPAVCLHSSAFHHPSALFKRRTFSLISFAFSKTGYSIE